MRFSNRLGFFLVFMVSVLSIAFALYMEHVEGLMPCPLCVFQRIGVIAVGIFALLAVANNRMSKIWGGLIILSALGGMSVSLRQLWLQHLPLDQVPACGPGLDYMLDTLPLSEVFKKVFAGSGECAVIDWTFLGMSLAFWVAVFFVVVIIFVLWLLFRQRHAVPFAR